VVLEDGSEVLLDAETEMVVNFSKDTRSLDLKMGRASFSVNHDPARSFVVTAGDVLVRALGTVFNVYKKKKGSVKVSVSEGSVHVSKADSGQKLLVEKVEENTVKIGGSQLSRKKLAPQRPEKQAMISSVVINSGQEIVVEEKIYSLGVFDVDIKEIDDWRKGELCFRDTPLSVVIEEINRYLDDKIVIGDKHLNNLEINMVFKIKDKEYFLSTLEATIPITHKITSGKVKILLQKEKT